MLTSFAFILNPLDLVDGNGPIEIMPNYFFQKADSRQIKVVKETFTKLPASPFWLNSYEYDYGKFPETNSDNLKDALPLAQQDWKYWIIVSKDSKSDNNRRSEYYKIEHALSMLNNDLELGPVFFNPSGDQYQWNPRYIYNYFLDYPYGRRPATQITFKDIEEIGPIYNLFDHFFGRLYTDKFSIEDGRMVKLKDDYQDNFQHIDEAIHRFLELRRLPRYSGLTIIGLFSIIESLITHNPNHNLHDSLTHQISTKIPLLRKRFQRPLDYEYYFDKVKEEKTIWSKLYSFRSKVVHRGSDEIENDKELKALKNLINVTDFLKETVKLLILLALKEPELITDLKKV